ncbi:hypothetical protein D3OALGA1CA_3878 [Olavius algarvensis associated proteobacterium Delta 3]|nr:hypothetical protein D3OALGA1CA_3878 [Olavius algarvensis associated proteobacterium Delta 3]CAB5166961.1 hypothetical protein D3OALGB2SA_5828 [Olavius algarvensis associated proteobacterium Delta 3]
MIYINFKSNVKQSAVTMIPSVSGRECTLPQKTVQLKK